MARYTSKVTLLVKMQSWKKSFLMFSALLIMFSSVQALNFGTFPLEEQKTSSDLTETYRIAFVNPGERALRVNFSAEPSPEYRVIFPEESFVLEPSPPTSDPAGSGWYHLGNGQYTEYTVKQFEVRASRERFSNTLNIPVRLEASIENPSNTGGTTQRLVQVREYYFTLRLDRSLEIEEEEEPEQDYRFWEEVDPQQDEMDRQEQEEEEETQQSVEETERKENSSQSYKSTEKDENIGESGVNNVTLALVAGILVSAGYVYWVL